MFEQRLFASIHGHKQKIRCARIDDDAGQLSQRRGQALALGDDAIPHRQEALMVLKRHERDRLAEDAQGEDGDDLLQLGGQRRRGQCIADARPPLHKTC